MKRRRHSPRPDISFVSDRRATSAVEFAHLSPLFLLLLFGLIAFGIYFLGWLSDEMKAAHGTDSLKYSILYGLCFYLLAAVFYLFASRRLRADLKS